MVADIDIDIRVRRFQPQDAGAIAQLFHDTVRTINRQHYSQPQVEAWDPENIHFRDWVAVCSGRYTAIAEVDGEIAGFGELEANGHIDCFYCHQDYQGQGVGRRLYQALEDEAKVLGLSRLFVEASITAHPFFERMGFAMLKEQQVLHRGQAFVNYIMEKNLRYPTVD
ncbi:MAG: GNAT family N-acetyltransferase [Cyanobacteria bacterium J06632_22]